MIRINKVDKYFNKYKKNEIHVINNTSLKLDDTGLVALLGPSGSGKTTLLNVIGGLDSIRSGNIYINNDKISGFFQGPIDRIRNLNIGYIFQDYKLIDNMSVYDNVSIVLKMIGIKDKKEIEKRVVYVLDKVGMLRYKKRPCGMLSGGERQRVGIARALVKNPKIILADEPTGNLDSKNSIEIMNIIKAISKDKLVVLVTHEKNLANFYATRIIELEDGKVIKDYLNDNTNDLDYEIANKLYLKDYTYKSNYNDRVCVYSNEENDLNLKIVFNKNSIYIKTFDNRKIEVLDNDSSIEMIDDYKKNLTMKDIENYEFDYENIINNPKKLKYSSIFNPITFITNGFNKVFDYSLIKKILLIGFFLAGAFLLYSTSSVVSSLTIKDKDFITINRDYLTISMKKVKYEDYLKYENGLDIEYLIPTDSIVNLKLQASDFYQTNQHSLILTGSLSDINRVNNSKLLLGRMPDTKTEILVDKLVLDKTIDKMESKMLGYSTYEKFLDKNISIDKMGDYKIVGVVDSTSPNIYFNKDDFINIIYHKEEVIDTDMEMFHIEEESKEYGYDDFNLYTNRVVLKEGRWPTNDYETIVNIENKETMKLNKEINKTINGRKLLVVGYYTSPDEDKTYLVNNNMIKILTVNKSSNISVLSSNKENTLSIARNTYNLNIKDSYEHSRSEFIRSKKEEIKTSIISSLIILIISLIEIVLMIRSSFLSRIKEVGTYRAIGVKKKDIYIMFMGEIIAITTLASVPGIILGAYIMKLLSNIEYLKDTIVINMPIVIFSIILIYVFNLIVGLIPVFNTMRKRPAEILARTDI